MSRKSILVVDDEKPQREILEAILTSVGYDVTTASSGEAALRIQRERRFDLALTDLKMTGMDGIELLSKLLAFDSSIIVLLLTAHGSIESAKEALESHVRQLAMELARTGKGITANCLRYLNNGFRAQWGFMGTPLRIWIRGRREERS